LLLAAAAPLGVRKGCEVCFVSAGLLIKRSVMMLHSFIKKTQKTPQREIEIALKRLKEVKHANA
jgi:phage-related protein